MKRVREKAKSQKRGEAVEQGLQQDICMASGQRAWTERTRTERNHREESRWRERGFDPRAWVSLQKPCYCCIYLEGWLVPRRGRN